MLTGQRGGSLYVLEGQNWYGGPTTWHGECYSGKNGIILGLKRCTTLWMDPQEVNALAIYPEMRGLGIISDHYIKNNIYIITNNNKMVGNNKSITTLLLIKLGITNTILKRKRIPRVAHHINSWISLNVHLQIYFFQRIKVSISASHSQSISSLLLQSWPSPFMLLSPYFLLIVAVFHHLQLQLLKVTPAARACCLSGWLFLLSVQFLNTHI